MQCRAGLSAPGWDPHTLHWLVAVTPHGGLQPADLLCQVTRAVRRVQDFIIKYRKVERQAKPDGMRGLHFRLGDIECFLVGSFTVLCRCWSKVNVLIKLDRTKYC